MKHLTIIIFLLITITSYSQKFVEKFYTPYWEETVSNYDASFVARINKTDSGYVKTTFYINADREKIEMYGLYKDNHLDTPNGNFYWYYPNGSIKKQGKFVNGKKQGEWLEWFSDKRIKRVTNYTNSGIEDYSVSWFQNGNTRDSSYFDAEGNGIYFEWFLNGTLSAEGRYKNHSKNGRWVYYHSNTKVSAVELYKKDSLVLHQYFNDDGSESADTTIVQENTGFIGGSKAWNNYVTSYLHSPTGVLMNNAHIAGVVVEFIVDEKGDIKNIEIAAPFHSKYDEAVIKFIKASPKWKPARNHNRFVESTVTMPVQFSQSWR